MIATTAPYPVPEQVLTECVSTASRTYGVPEVVIRAILMVEGGKVGTMSRNTNGSYDLGPMQLNTINLSIINKEYPFLTWRHITYNPCINIMVGTWFLGKKIKNRNGVIWEGVGDYHSVTPSKRIVYQTKFLRHYNALKAKYGFKPAQIEPIPGAQFAQVQTAPAAKVVTQATQYRVPSILTGDLPAPVVGLGIKHPASFSDLYAMSKSI